MLNGVVGLGSLLSPLVVVVSLAANPAFARDLNAGFVVEEMSGAEQFAYVSGVVEGLATALKTANPDRPDATDCIHTWFYGDPDSMKSALAAFAYFPDRLPGDVVQAIVAQRCGP